MRVIIWIFIIKLYKKMMKAANLLGKIYGLRFNAIMEIMDTFIFKIKNFKTGVFNFAI